MDLVRKIFEVIECSVWIKNGNNEIIFINNYLKENFDIKTYKTDIELNKYLNSRNELNKLIDKISITQKPSTSILKFNNKFYKQVSFKYENKSNYLAGILVEIPEIKELKNSTYEKNILQTVIDNIPELIFYKDQNLKYVGVNKECEKFYNERGIDSVIGKTDIELPLDKTFVENCAKHDKMVLESKKPLYIEEEAPIENSSEYNTFETIKTPILNEDGSLWGLVGVVRDITQQKRIEQKLRYLSYTDRLTELYNRAYFDEKIEELINNKEFPIGIIIGDVNGLKIVNDTIGHLEGDKLLKEMSTVLKQTCLDKGFVFRWGGDEFVTVLPKSSELECTNVMNKVSDICNEQVYENFKLSIAQGYALLDENSSIDEVLRESEDKVYRQKILDNKSVRTSILSTLKQNLQNKNVETEEHTERVANYCLKVGSILKLDEETMDKLLLVGKLHDIGKIGIPEYILLKSNKLTDDEYEIMKTHSEKGYRLALLLPELSHIARGILTHHERWDGTGYPLGLKGEEIPLISRIVAVVDAYDAMTNDRVYSKGRSKEEAISEIKRCSNSQFDPNIVNVFCSIIE